jgi:hypothetical protein
MGKPVNRSQGFEENVKLGSVQGDRFCLLARCFARRGWVE